ncbi:MAG: Chagasin family peptidase inhibitor I42 [Euryarchaeota archaeon ADurb.Bin190]|nr:MAG: Chagasin family peptidase inhibitor I42 [Euryarchaeota archaeon ADurb.Bin190]
MGRHNKYLVLGITLVLLAIYTAISQADITVIQAELNKPFNITLESNPTTGYTWTVDFNHKMLIGGEKGYSASRPGAVGGSGQQVFVFTPIQEGQTEISAAYKRSWEESAAEERTFRVNCVGND